MYIILSKTTEKTAVIKDKTEIAGYINQDVRVLRRLMKDKVRIEIGDFIIIEPNYVQSRSNSGGKREKKQEFE